MHSNDDDDNDDDDKFKQEDVLFRAGQIVVFFYQSVL